MHVQGRAEGTQPLPRVPSLDEGPSEAQASKPHVGLIRDVQDLNDDQLWEVLEALQTKMAQREGLCPNWGHPRGI